MIFSIYFELVPFPEIIHIKIQIIQIQKVPTVIDKTSKKNTIKFIKDLSKHSYLSQILVHLYNIKHKNVHKIQHKANSLN